MFSLSRYAPDPFDFAYGFAQDDQEKSNNMFPHYRLRFLKSNNKTFTIEEPAEGAKFAPSAGLYFNITLIYCFACSGKEFVALCDDLSILI